MCMLKPECYILHTVTRTTEALPIKIAFCLYLREINRSHQYMNRQLHAY